MEKAKTGNEIGFTELVSKEPHLTRFSEAMKIAGLAESFSGADNYTVFAPTNEAFNRLPQDKVNALMQPASRDQLKNLLLLHIVPGALNVDDLKKVTTLKTKAGRDIKVDVAKDAKEIKIENARLTQPIKEVNNWRLYAVDAVLQPTTRAASA